MFDFAWSEIALIAGVALVLIGPKDLPVAIRTVTGMIKKARRMAAEFQTHVDEMVREANLDEVRSQINEIRNFDVRSHVERAVDPDGGLRNTFNERLNLTPTQTVDPLPEVIIPEPPGSTEPVPAAEAASQIAPPGVAGPEVTGAEAKHAAPAWLPPNFIPPTERMLPSRPAEAPPFIPPYVVMQQRSHPPA